MELLLGHFSQLGTFISKIAYLNVRSAFLFPLGVGLSDTALPPQTEAARRSVQNQSAPALKGQYVANKHTEQSECWAASQTKAVITLWSHTCITHSVRVLPCEESTGLMDESPGNKSCSLWEATAQPLSSPAVHRTFHLLTHHVFLLNSWLTWCTRICVEGKNLSLNTLHTWLQSSKQAALQRSRPVFCRCSSYIFNQFGCCKATAVCLM